MYYALKGTLHVTCSQCAYPVIFFYNGKPAMLIQYCGHCGSRITAKVIVEVEEAPCIGPKTEIAATEETP